MKVQLLAFTIVLSTTQIFAQVGVGTNTPNASAQLDVSSNNKGLLAPRMTSAQRTGIASPAKGLLVYDTSVNGLYHYNGAAWASVGGGGGFSLPFSQTINLGISAFQVTNEGTGAAIEGASTNDYGTGTIAKATGDFGRGLTAYTNKPGGNSIYAIADSGRVFHGENNYAGTNTTLMSLLNRGIAKTATFQLSNNSSADANVQIAGNNLGEQLLIFQTNAANTKSAVSINNSGIGAGISSVANNGTAVIATSINDTAIIATSTNGAGLVGKSTSNIGVSGVSTTSYGIKGVTSTGVGAAGVYGVNNGTTGSGVYGTANFAIGVGVYGFSTTGTGVKGYTESNIGVQGQAVSGTALSGISTSGYSLDVSGKIKIAGGNTSPSAGAVLTSVDASGNAVWKKNKIGFSVNGAINTAIPENTAVKVEFNSEGYDVDNNFVPYAGATTPGSSVFTAPIAGVYHFSANIYFYMNSDVHNFSYGRIFIIKNGIDIAVVNGLPDNDSNSSGVTLQIDGDFHLAANDKIWIAARQANSAGTAQGFDNITTPGRFTGHLVFAD